MVYMDQWGMRERPFDNGHALRFFVPVENARLGLGKLRYVVSSGLGASLLVSSAGCGKTSIARVLMNDLADAGWVTAYLPNPSGECGEVMSLIAHLFGEVGASYSASPVERLTGQLLRLSENGAKLCLLVDDVHTVQDNLILENLRMLMNLENDGEPVLNLVLAGQPPVDGMLRATSDFSSHIALRVNVEPLDIDEMKKYILYRLKVAGCNRGIFTRYAAEKLFELSKGVPRNINRLCELSLLTGFGLGEKKIGPEIIEMAANDLGMVQSVQAPAQPVVTVADAPPPPEAGDEMDILADLAPVSAG